MGRDGNGNGVKGIPPSNHKNSTSAFMNVDISSISRCLCRASPKNLPISHPSPTRHPRTILLKPPPQTPTAYPPMYIRDITKNRIHTKQPLEKHMRHGQMQSKLPIPKRRPLAAQRRDSDFAKPEKETTRKTKGKEASPPPLFVCPQPAEKKAAEKNAKFDTTTQCMLPVLSKRERKREKGKLDPEVSVGVMCVCVCCVGCRVLCCVVDV